MASPTPSPTPTNSSTNFKPTSPASITSPASSNATQTQGWVASQAAAVPPAAAAVSVVPSARWPPPPGLLLVVIGVVRQLFALGFIASLEVPVSELCEERASALFGRVLSAFLIEAMGRRVFWRMTPPAVEDGRRVDLLRLYVAVRARGGFAFVASWAGVARAVGLEAAASVSVQLIYNNYLAVLEQCIPNPGKEFEDFLNSGASDLHVGAKKHKSLAPANDSASAEPSHQKRKREPVVGMLNWLRNVAKSPQNPYVVGRNPNSHLSLALQLRGEMVQNKEDHNSLTRPLSPQAAGAAVDNYGGGLQTEGAIKNGEMHDEEIEPDGQVEVPEWTGKPSVPSDDPDTLRFLRTPLMHPEKEQSQEMALDTAALGKGRPDECQCQFPGSIACVRFHVAEVKTKLKRELGLAFYTMGFDRMGEEVALSWTKEEEDKFNAIIQRNLVAEELVEQAVCCISFQGKERHCDYYFNVFLIRRRAHQNRLTPGSIDSDDDAAKPGFLRSVRPGGVQRGTRSAASARA